MAEKLRRDIERIVQLTDDEFEEVLSFFTIKDFKKHQFIFEKGEKVKHIYFVSSGLLKLLYYDSSENQHI